MIQKTILFFALLITMSNYGQKQQASPYSFFGIGNNFLSKTVEENTMGGIGTALSIPGSLNFSNPAALSGLRFTTYSLAVINSSNWVTDQNTTQKSSIFSLSYLGLGIPIGDRGGLTAGIRARTGVGYNMYATDATNALSTYAYEGSGGASSLFVAGGYQIAKGFSLGLEAAFIFGEIEHVVTEQQDGISYDSREKSNSSLRGIETKLGLFYTSKIGKTKNLNLGLTIANNSEIDITETSVFYKEFFSGDSEEIKLTLDPVMYYGTVVNPLNTTVAVAYGNRSKWQTSFEYSFNKAQSFSGEALSITQEV